MGKTYIIRNRLTDKGFPTNQKGYPSAHGQADKKEKQKFPKDYEKMKKVDAKLPKGELAGKNARDGKVYVSKKVPKKYRKEVQFHESVENKILRKKK